MRKFHSITPYSQNIIENIYTQQKRFRNCRKMVTVQPRTSHHAAKSVRKHRGWDASSQPRSGFCMAWCLWQEAEGWTVTENEGVNSNRYLRGFWAHIERYKKRRNPIDILGIRVYNKYIENIQMHSTSVLIAGERQIDLYLATEGYIMSRKGYADRNLRFETLQLHVGQEAPDPVDRKSVV